MTSSRLSYRLIKSFKIVGAVTIFGLMVLVFLSLISGYGFNLRRFGSDTKKLALLLLNSQKIKSYSKGEYTNIVFLHQSVGFNLVQDGNVRQLFTEAGYTFWDQGYNEWGMVGPNGSSTGYHYRVPSDNTYPDGLANILSQHVYPFPLNTFSALLQHEVLIFKSCYPASAISSDEKLAQYKLSYQKIGQVASRYPDHIFIFFTTPPLNPASTDLETAARARSFANWLKSDEFLSGHANIFVFDFFDLLAENDPASPEYNMLRADYREGTDSHPTPQANQIIGPLFTNFVIQSIEDYR